MVVALSDSRLNQLPSLLFTLPLRRMRRKTHLAKRSDGRFNRGCSPRPAMALPAHRGRDAARPALSWLNLADHRPHLRPSVVRGEGAPGARGCASARRKLRDVEGRGGAALLGRRRNAARAHASVLMVLISGADGTPPAARSLLIAPRFLPLRLDDPGRTAPLA